MVNRYNDNDNIYIDNNNGNDDSDKHIQKCG